MQHPKTRGGMTGSNTKPRTSGPKAVDHGWQRAPTSEKKRVGKIPELEFQLAQLQEELKKSKEQLYESESRTKRANHEAEEAKKLLAAMSAKLNESQKQLDELWASEEARIQELRKISQDRDRAWESELKAIQKHLTTTITENQKLNTRLQKVVESEAAYAKQAETAHNEVMTLKLELSETDDIIEEIKVQLTESKDSEARALEQLEMLKQRIEKDKSGEATRAVELASALAANVEMANELRRLKVQTEQWRKAAEVAAAMVLGGNDGGGGGDVGDGKFVDSFEFNVVGEKSNSSYFEDIEDESSVKKTSNMLRKFGVLLKKAQK